MTNNQGLTALVVDDESSVRDLITMVLRVQVPNLKVEQAKDGEEAYQKIREGKPDILYTDIKMPNMGGDDLLERLVAEGLITPTFVIASHTVDSRGTKAIHYSHRMFGDAQAAALNLPVQPSLDATEAFIQKQINDTMLSGATPSFGFNVITKPCRMGDIVERTKYLIKNLYSPDNSQS